MDPIETQSMAAMSCCPGGAIAMLGVGLGHVVARVARRRDRKRELTMLAQMWDADCVVPPTRQS